MRALSVVVVAAAAVVLFLFLCLVVVVVAYFNAHRVYSGRTHILRYETPTYYDYYYYYLATCIRVMCCDKQRR